MRRRDLLPRLRPGIAVAALLCLVVAADSATGPGPVQAQEGPEHSYVDLVLTHEYWSSIAPTAMSPLHVRYRVRNVGTATADGVAVSFLLEDLQFSSADGFAPQDRRTVDGTNETFTWEVGTIPPGGTRAADFSTALHSGISTVFLPGGEYRIGVINATASSLQPEPRTLLANNTIKVYSHAIGPYRSDHMKGNALGLLLDVSDLRPAAGGDVTFDLTARNFLGLGSSYVINLIDDIEITVELSDGLQFKSEADWTRPDGFVTSGRTAAWQPEAVDARLSTDYYITYPDRPGSREIEIQTQLTSDSLDAIPLEERCFTARVTDSTPPPEPGYALSSLTQCLGDAPSLPWLLRGGEITLIDFYPCIGVTSSPCSSADTLELLATVDAADDLDTWGLNWRETRANFGNLLQPDSFIVHVPDYAGRTRKGGSAIWSTGRLMDLIEGQTRLTSAWSIKESVTVTAPGGGDAPGRWLLTSTDDSAQGNFDLLDAVDSSPVTYDFYDLSDLGTDPADYYFDVKVDFWALGTYKALFGITGRLSGTTYTDTETYTFHVGPIAELAVEDGGASAHAPADRNALTIVAVNNGPDAAPARVTGLPTGAEALHISQGSYDSGTGVWNIGELELRDVLQASGRPQATLVLGASAGDTASVTIANSKDYEVCIDSDGADLAHTTQTACEAVTGASWHTTNYYDYIDDNNTATITAARGTGGVGPDAPGNPRTQTGTIVVMWEPVEYLHGAPVTHYDIQWLGGSIWTTLATGVTGTRYVDAAPGSRRDYRVRAVNAAGVGGPWSRSTATVQAGLAGPPVNLRTQADGNTAIDVSWDAPEDAGGSAVTGYTVQWSLDGTGGWRSAGSTADQTFKQRGLPTGAIRYYRVAARNGGGLGAWSDAVIGQTVSGVPLAPALTARTLSDYAVALTWTEPHDNGQPITGYRVEFSPDGSADSWERLTEVGADLTAYTDDSLSANTRRYYRVQAVNSVGGGAWSRTVSAITQLTPPDAPWLSDVAADGPNAIVVTWREPDYLGDLAVTQYQVQYAKNQYAEIWRGPATLSSSARSWRHTGLQPDETWYYQVRASNGGGRWSAWSHMGAATTAPAGAPRTVSGFSARYDPAPDEVALSWTESTSGAATWYEVDRSEDGIEWRTLSASPSCDAGTCAWADTDLWPGASLHYRVRAVTADGEGPWSSRQSATRPPDPPGGPRLDWVASDGSNHIVLEWSAPYGDGGADVSGYRLLWCRTLDGADENPCDVAPDEANPLADPRGYSAISLGVSARAYTHSVTPGYFYYYLVRATNGGNRWSEWEAYDLSYARTYAGVPAAPGLTARAVDAEQITLTWTRPGSASEIREYWLYVYEDGERLHDFDNIVDVLTIRGDLTEWTIDEGLSSGTTLYFRIRALNDNGEGKYSPLRQATTP